MRRVLISLLVSAPLIDYTWNFRFAKFGGLEVSPNRIYKVLPLILLFLFFFLLLDRRKLFLHKQAVIIILYITAIPLTIGLFSYPFQSLDAWLRFLSSFVFLFMVGRFVRANEILSVFRWLTFFSFIPILISFAQVYGVVPYLDYDYGIFGEERIGRVSGGYLKPNNLVGYLMYTFAFILCSLYSTKGGYLRKVIYSVYLIAVSACVILSYHRVSYAIFLTIFGIISWLYGKRKLVIFGYPLLFVILVTLGWNIFYELFWTLISPREFGELLRGRMLVWITYASEFLNSNIFFQIFGRGNTVISSDLLPYFFEGKYFDEPHNDLIRIIYQYGITGFFFFILLFWNFLKTSLIFVKGAKEKPNKVIGSMSVAIGIALVFYQVTTEPSRYPSFFWYYSAIMSYILVKLKTVKKL